MLLNGAEIDQRGRLKVTKSRACSVIDPPSSRERFFYIPSWIYGAFAHKGLISPQYTPCSVGPVDPRNRAVYLR